MNIQLLLKSVQKASRKLAILPESTINEVLIALSKSIVQNIEIILIENEKDLVKMDVKNPKYDRLKLTEKRIKDIANDIANVASLPYPIGRILEHKTLSNGLDLTKISVPLGVLGIIYEARPNVTLDCFSLAIKSGNACVLKGGSDAENSNMILVKLIHEVLLRYNLDTNMIGLLPSDRSATEELLQAVGLVDVIIPRGSQNLIDYVRNNSKVPVIETGAGIVHAFFDRSANVEIGKNIINNAKTRRVSVCNALDCVLIHQDRLADLAELVAPLKNQHVEIQADQEAYKFLKNKYPEHLLKLATKESFGTEFLDYKMAIKTVIDFNHAIDYIAENSSKHSEMIISEDQIAIDSFLLQVDAAALYVNSSSAFTDGAQFGMGAEIGISTQKLHARGPMALPELTSYKWLVKGNGQIRN